jgi:hypothetical protein
LGYDGDDAGNVAPAKVVWSAAMADFSIPAHVTPGEFRVGRVFSRSYAIYCAHFAAFFLLGTISALPALLIDGTEFVQSPGTPAAAGGMVLLAELLSLIIGPLVQAVILYGAFQDMRGRGVRIGESLGVALRRFFPVVGVALSVGLAVAVGFLLLIAPAGFFASIFFVAAPVCVVERLGPFKSMRRSEHLTSGHRWKVFGMVILLLIVDMIVDNVIELGLEPVAGPIPALAARLIWGALYGGFGALIAVVSYHDLRVAKEGIDIEQIAAVFD